MLDIMGSIGLIDAELTARSILRNQSIEDCAWNQYISLQENLSPATRKSVLHVFNEVRKQKNTPVKEGMERCPVEVRPSNLYYKILLDLTHCLCSYPPSQRSSSYIITLSAISMCQLLSDHSKSNTMLCTYRYYLEGKPCSCNRMQVFHSFLQYFSKLFMAFINGK